MLGEDGGGGGNASDCGNNGGNGVLHNGAKTFKSFLKFNLSTKPNDDDNGSADDKNGVDENDGGGGVDGGIVAPQNQTEVAKTTPKSKKFELLTAQSVAKVDDISKAKKNPVLNRISMFLASNEYGNMAAERNNIDITPHHDVTCHQNDVRNDEESVVGGVKGGEIDGGVFERCGDLNDDGVEMEVKDGDDEEEVCKEEDVYMYHDEEEEEEDGVCDDEEDGVCDGEEDGVCDEEEDGVCDEEEDGVCDDDEDGVCDEEEDGVEMRMSRRPDDIMSFEGEHLPSRMAQMGLLDKRQSRSIKDRLSDLQKGSESWRNKISPDKQLATLASRNSLLKKNPLFLTRSNEAEKREIKESSSKLGRSCINISSCKDQGILARTSSKHDIENAESSPKPLSKKPSNHFSPLSERLMRLEESQDKWTNRTSDVNDAYKFTIAEKMKKMGVHGHSNLSHISKPSLRPASMIETSLPSHVTCKGVSKSPYSAGKSTQLGGSERQRVKIPRMEDDVLFQTSFHHVIDKGRENGGGENSEDGAREDGGDENGDDDFDAILKDLDTRQVQRLRHVRKVGRKVSLKTLNTRSWHEDQYMEVKLSHVPPSKKVIGHGNFAREALAGLASKEELSQKLLKKSSVCAEAHLPYKHPMLIHLKGRRECQARLVEPTHKSLNSGDCFVLVTKSVVFLFIGTFSNIIEKTKAQDLANHVRDKHDLGVATDCTLVTIEEGKHSSLRAVRTFWNILGVTESVTIAPPGPSEEDEVYEAGIIGTNVVCTLDAEGLLSRVPQCSGALLTKQILTPEQVLLFDFGSEMYTWVGKKVDMSHRKKVLKLGLEAWGRGFDYSQHPLNPIYPFDQKGSKVDDKRPEWCLFAKLSQGLETVLFKSKFKDFGGCDRMVKVAGEDCKESGVHEELRSCDVDEMVRGEDTRVGVLQLEGCNIGRGAKWSEVVDGIKWQHEMLTISLEKWLLGEEVRHLGDFHEEDTYVIKWIYMLNQLRHNLKGERVSMYDTPSKQLNTPKSTGRHRTAYFYWQGQRASVGDKAVSALTTIELDVESAPQVRVVQGQEPSCFVGLFQPMIVHHGRMNNQSTNSDATQLTCSDIPTDVVMETKKMFMLRNELEDDAYLQQVRCDVTSLRSRTSFLLVDLVSGRVLVWHGCKSSKGQRGVMMKMCESLRGGRRLGVELDGWSEVEEGDQINFFNTTAPYSLINDTRSYHHTPRLLHFTCTCGTFKTENVVWHKNHTNEEASVFPFYQHDLYNVETPAFFLVDNHHEAYLWHAPEPQDEITTRSKQIRRLAIESTINYCAAKEPPMPCYLVTSGLEPHSFKHIFPTWSDAPTTHASQTSASENMVSLIDLFKRETCQTYSLQQLLCRPDHLDDLNLEKYLDPDQFQDTFGMNSSMFYSLPMWKQIKMKQDVGLF